ncbi:MAG: LysM peptidoglycan-binding domain-containing protein [Gammaproteobacteria bacterium]|nr:LysM peptidoglycan-binding domain-containing protein [Gammaproteobacteria bacterium]
MSLRLNRIWLLPALLIAGESWALGLGDIRLSSALNEPLRAEIELLSATPEELANLDIQLASQDTFERYGIDRPLYLTSMVFDVVKSGSADGNLIRVTTPQPVSEPFVTFLIEAVWSRGRLLREYTLLLDPPTFAPAPAQQSTQTLAAPRQAAPADSGTIQRPAPQAAPPPRSSAAPAPRQAAPSPRDTGPFDTTDGGNYRVRRGDTLWAIAQQVRPDERLNTNQTMIAIYEQNQQAFAGNINRLSAGAMLRIPSADEIFRISRGEALDEVRRQTAEWSSGSPAPRSGPSLTLVPPESDTSSFAGTVSQTSTSDPGADAAARARINELEQRIAEQESLLEIRDNELAMLREELARIRNEGLTAPDTAPTDIDETDMAEEPVDDIDGIFAEDPDEFGAGQDPVADAGEEQPAEPAQDTTPAPTVVSTRPSRDEGIVDKILGFLTSTWGLIGAALLVVLGILVWFAKRAGRDDIESTGVWDALDADEVADENLDSTERLRALAREDDEAIVVVEQGTTPREPTIEPELSGTFEAEAPAEAPPIDVAASGDTDTSRSLEDTFSSDTAINLDQSDPIAEADFHMAYGLYDQAADLINGALSIEPERQDLLAKLSEIYFVWGNRDGFIEAAQRLRAAVNDDRDPAWDKVVIMGQQIAGDHELFEGAVAGSATAVDLSFDGAMDEPSALDIDFAGSGPDGSVSDVIDLTAESGEVEGVDLEASGIDFPFGDDTTSASVTAEMPNPSGAEETSNAPTLDQFAMDGADETAEAPSISGSDSTIETPTIEQQFESLESTSELPALSENDEGLAEFANFDDDKSPADATAEINLDDLGLNLDELADSDLVGDIIDDDDIAMEGEGLDTTGKNPQVDDLPESTGIHSEDDVASALQSTSEMPGLRDRTGENTMFDDDDGDVTVDQSLLDATGQTQVLSEDMIVDSLSDDEQTMMAPGPDDAAGDAETLLASMDDEDEDADADFDFAKTEALPKDSFSGDDETAESPGMAGVTDMDLDLDDLTAALKVSALGDTVDQPRDDATVEHPRFAGNRDVDLDVGDLGALQDDPTQAMSPDEVSGDLHDARTMTEVGTKLDLARAYVDMGDPEGARSILQEVLEEGDEAQRQQAQQLLDTLPS